ncbi:MAG TPA: glycosyltransferase family 4 protein [Clostridia bacterium]|nr:glycosyltransferase family 4 protein [Clostridia bacterium]
MKYPITKKHEIGSGLTEKGIYKVLYASSVDISLPNGPGVNEREFLVAASEKWGKNLTAIIPRLSHKIDSHLNVHIEWCPHVSNTSPISFLRHQVAIYYKLRRQMAREKYDLIIIRLGVLPLGLWFALKSSCTPYVVKTSGGFPKASLQIQKGAKRLIMQLVNPLEYKLQRDLLQGAKAVDACTVGLARGIIHNYRVRNENVRVIDNATNVNRFFPQDSQYYRKKLGISKFQPLIGYVGGRPWERGANQLIKVLPELMSFFPDIGVLIVGGDKKMSGMRKLTDEFQVADRVVFTGTVPYEDVNQYINCLDVGVAFDRKDTREKGNANQKIRQYLACGVPVVTSGSGNDFLVSHGLGSIIDDFDNLDVLKDALVKWASMNDIDRHRYKKLARDYAVKHLSVNKALEERILFWKSRLSEGENEPD